MALALPDGPRGRALALGVTAAALSVLWIGVIQPVLDSYAEGADTLERRTALAGRMSDIADSLPMLRAQASDRSLAGPPRSATLEGATDAIAGANLQSLVEGMATAAGAHLTSTEALPAEAVGQNRRIALRVSVDATWVVLVRLLGAVAQAAPHMFIDDLQLHAQPTAAQTRELPLDISFTVLAFRSLMPADGAAAGRAGPPGPDAASPAGAPRPVAPGGAAAGPPAFQPQAARDGPASRPAGQGAVDGPNGGMASGADVAGADTPGADRAGADGTAMTPGPDEAARAPAATDGPSLPPAGPIGPGPR